MNRGVAFALFAYIFWGLHPIYWKMLKHVPATEIVAHRIIWSLLFFIVVLSLQKQWKHFKNQLKRKSSRWLFIVPAFLIGSNWATYIWAVTNGYILETSLGYFISPLISVALGVIVLKERLRKFQWLAVLIAALGVFIMTFLYGQFPWISLFLAGTWAIYGLLRKRSPLSPTEGLTLETMLMLLPALIYLGILYVSGPGEAFTSTNTLILLAGSGIISGLPLIIFIAGSKLIDLSLIGILQYIYPTLIFIIGFVIYKEPLDQSKLTGFVFIWLAILLYTIEGSTFVKRNGKSRF